MLTRQQCFCIDAYCVNNAFQGPDFVLVDVTLGRMERIFHVSNIVRSLDIIAIVIPNNLPDWYCGDPLAVRSAIMDQDRQDNQGFDRIAYIFDHIFEFDVGDCESRLIVSTDDVMWEAESQTGQLYRTEPVSIKLLASRINPLMAQTLAMR